MKPGELVRTNLPSWYPMLDSLQGKIGIITKVEHIVNGTQVGLRRVHVLVECDVRLFDVNYLEAVDEAG